jgi:hypothetical protein
MGNVIMFNNALNSTQELIYFIEDIRIFKVQTNINEDWQLTSPSQEQQTCKSYLAPSFSHCLRKTMLVSPHTSTADHLSTSQCTSTQRRHGLEEQTNGTLKRNGFMQ